MRPGQLTVASINEKFNQAKNKAVMLHNAALEIEKRLAPLLDNGTVKFSFDSGMAPAFKWELVCWNEFIPTVRDHLGGGLVYIQLQQINGGTWEVYEIVGSPIKLRCRA